MLPIQIVVELRANRPQIVQEKQNDGLLIIVLHLHQIAGGPLNTSREALDHLHRVEHLPIDQYPHALHKPVQSSPLIHHLHISSADVLEPSTHDFDDVGDLGCLGEELVLHHVESKRDNLVDHHCLLQDVIFLLQDEQSFVVVELDRISREKAFE